MSHTLKTLDYSVLQQCMHCGMCLPTCPTYDTTKRERNSPRGRISLMRAIADGELAVNETFADEMSYCLGCLACQTACPAGVNYAELFETARADIEGSGVNASASRGVWRAITLRFLFMRPDALRLAGALLRVYQRSGLETLVRRFGLIRLAPATLRRLEPQAPRIAPAFSHRLIREHELTREPPRYHVAMLTGCIQDLVFPDVNRDTVDVLLANGCRVFTPPEQPCCGSLHAHNGETRLAASLARRNIDLFPPDEFDAIITNAGGCGSHLRHYSGLLGDDPRYAERAREWDQQGQGRPGVAGAHRLPGAARGTIRRADDDHVPRVVSPGPRPEDHQGTTDVAASACQTSRSWNCRSPHGAAAAPASTPSRNRNRPISC